MNASTPTTINPTAPTTEDDGYLLYLRAMEEAAEPIDWHEVDAELEVMRRRDLDVDAAQGEYSDWRWA